LPKEKKRRKPRDRVFDILQRDAWGVSKPAKSQRAVLNLANEALRQKYGCELKQLTALKARGIKTAMQKWYACEDELVELLPVVIDRMRTHLCFHREKEGDHRKCVEPHFIAHRWEEFVPSDDEQLLARFRKWLRASPEMRAVCSHTQWVIYLRIEGPSLPERLRERARTKYLDERRQIYAPDLTQDELDARLDKWESRLRDSVKGRQGA
jgi:hypothetical protein